MKKFLKDLKKSGGHVLDTVRTYNGKIMIYYREYGSLVSDIKTVVF